LQSKASGFKRIIYKELYPGIDVIYSFNENTKAGFEYSVVVKTGADINMVKMKYGGDVKKIKRSINRALVIKSDIGEIEETMPVSYYGVYPLYKKSLKNKIRFQYQHRQSQVLIHFVKVVVVPQYTLRLMFLVIVIPGL